MTARISGVIVQRTPEVGGEVLRQLREASLDAWLLRMEELEHRHREAAEQVSDAAQMCIGGEGNRRLRRALINMRRAVHNDQRSKALREYRVIGEEGGHVEGFGEWVDTCRRIKGHLRDGDDLLDECLRRSGDCLVNQAMRSGIGATIVTSSEPLGTALLGQGRLRPKDREDARRSLGDYVLRAATRTTPFGGFVRVSLLRDADLGGEVLVKGGDQPVRVPRLNIEVLAALRALVLESPRARRALTVRLTNGIALKDGRVRYVRRKVGRLHESGRVTRRSEDVFFLTNDALLEAVFHCFEEAEDWRLDELIEEVTQRVYPLVGPEETEDYVVELLRQAFIVAPVLDLSILEVDPLGRLVQELSTAGDGVGRRLHDALAEVHVLVTGLVGTDACSTTATLSRVSSLLEDVGLPADRCPSPLVYLDTIDARTGHYDAAAIDALAGSHLEDLAGILPLFDRTLPDKLLLQGFLRARHGRDEVVEDVLMLAQEFNEDLYDLYRERVDATPQVGSDGSPVPVLNWLELDEVDLLNRERAALAAAFGQRFHEWGSGRSQELELDREFFMDCRSNLPSLARRSYAVNVQPVRGGAGRTRLVVNGFYAGMGLMSSRFLHADSADTSPLVGAVRTSINEHGGNDVIYAEISGGHDSTNLNLHPQTLDWQIICPGESPRGRKSRAIALDDLSIVWKGGIAVLWSVEHGCQVVPVYQGFLVPSALPDLQRVLMLFSPMAVPVLDLWSGVDPPLGDKDISDHPRVCYGPLILVRHVWKMRPGYVPLLQDYGSRALWIAELERWRASNGLPMRIYATADTPPSMPSAVPGRTKPQFVDFRSPWTLEVLDRLVRGAHSRVIMVEALPDPSEVLTGAGLGTDRTTELVMEVRV